MSKIAHIRKITEVSDLDSEQEKINKYKKRVQLLQNYLNILRLQSTDNKNQLDKYQDTYLQQQAYANELLANKAQQDMQIQDIVNQTELEQGKYEKLQYKLGKERKRLEHLTIYQQTLFKREKKIDLLATHAKVYKKTLKAIRERVKEISILLGLDKYVKDYENKTLEKPITDYQCSSANQQLLHTQNDDIDTKVTAVFTENQLNQPKSLNTTQIKHQQIYEDLTQKKTRKPKKEQKQEIDNQITDSKIDAMEKEFQRFKEDLVVHVSDQFSDSKLQELQNQAQEGIKKLQNKEDDQNINFIQVNPLIDHNLGDKEEEIVQQQQLFDQKSSILTKNEQQLQLEHEFKQKMSHLQEKVHNFVVPEQISNVEHTNIASAIQTDPQLHNLNGSQSVIQNQYTGNQVSNTGAFSLLQTANNLEMHNNIPINTFVGNQSTIQMPPQSQYESLKPEVLITSQQPLTTSKLPISRSFQAQNSYFQPAIHSVTQTLPVQQNIANSVQNIPQINDRSSIISSPQLTFEEQIANRVVQKLQDAQINQNLPPPESLSIEMEKDVDQPTQKPKSYKNLKPASIARQGQKLIPQDLEQLTDTLQGLADGCRLIKQRSSSQNRSNSYGVSRSSKQKNSNLKSKYGLYDINWQGHANQKSKSTKSRSRSTKNDALMNKIRSVTLDVLTEQNNVREQLEEFHDGERKRLLEKLRGGFLRNPNNRRAYAEIRKRQRLEDLLERLAILRHRLASVHINDRRGATTAENLQRVAAAHIKELEALGCIVPFKKQFGV